MNTGLKMQKYGGHRECELAAGFEFYYNMDWKKFGLPGKEKPTFAHKQTGF